MSPTIERVAGQDQPRLGAASAIGDEKSDVFGRVAREVEHLELHVADFERVAVGDSDGNRIRRSTLSCRRYGAPADVREGAACRQMIGVNVRIDDISDRHSEIAGGAQIVLWRLDRIDDDARRSCRRSRRCTMRR